MSAYNGRASRLWQSRFGQSGRGTGRCVRTLRGLFDDRLVELHGVELAIVSNVRAEDRVLVKVARVDEDTGLPRLAYVVVDVMLSYSRL